jgi:hypothetical protein
MCRGGEACAVWNLIEAGIQGPARSPLNLSAQGGQLRIFRLGGPPQRRQSSVIPAGFLSRLLSGVEVGRHGCWGKGGAVDGDVGEAAGEEITAALQHPGP